ncbi:MAG: hypothetical protein M1354_04165 [Candidatus Marsarchaeota archaeon]|nr:hypothetical protein [Candidatus Marsarchaeota archaeon]
MAHRVYGNTVLKGLARLPGTEAQQERRVLPATLTSEIDRLRSHDGWLNAGIPKYNRLFGRDAAISAWQLLRYDPEIARSTLLELARLQGTKNDPETGEQPGKILHENTAVAIPGISWLRPNRPVYFSIDSTPLFLILAGKYYEATGDKMTLRKLQPNLVSAAKWILDYGMSSGLVRYDKPAGGKGLQSQSWKDGIGVLMDTLEGPVAVVEVQGYAYCALRSTAAILAGFADGALAVRMKEAAVLLKKRFNEEFWPPGADFPYLTIDGMGRKQAAITSNPGHLLFTGILNADQASRIVSRIFKPDMFTRCGIRTHSAASPDFDEYAYQLGSVWPHDNWVIAQGLKSAGYPWHYDAIKRAVSGALVGMGSSPEYMPIGFNGSAMGLADSRLVSPPCTPQAWSSGALADFLTEVRRG